MAVQPPLVQNESQLGETSPRPQPPRPGAPISLNLRRIKVGRGPRPILCSSDVSIAGRISSRLQQIQGPPLPPRVKAPGGHRLVDLRPGTETSAGDGLPHRPPPDDDTETPRPGKGGLPHQQGDVTAPLLPPDGAGHPLPLPDAGLPLLHAGAPRRPAATPPPSSGATAPPPCSRSPGPRAPLLPPDGGRLRPRGPSAGPLAPPGAAPAPAQRDARPRPPSRPLLASAGARRQVPTAPPERAGSPPPPLAEPTSSTCLGGRPAPRDASPTRAPRSRAVARGSSPRLTTTGPSAGSPAPQSHARPKELLRAPSR